uniref:CDK5RAP1-like protein n=1 Tax=Enterobius vermicularis TaxID=51028 RepID=A0A0N4V373_ENTVE
MCNFSRDALSSFMFVQEVFYLCFGLILLPSNKFGASLQFCFCGRSWRLAMARPGFDFKNIWALKRRLLEFLINIAGVGSGLVCKVVSWICAERSLAGRCSTCKYSIFSTDFADETRERSGPLVLEDRSTGQGADGESLFNVVYNNPYLSLSIQQQRARLPIFKHRNQILYLLEKFRTLVIVGETGSGKSTQVPQYLLESGWASNGRKIGVTQPRRVAALARRVAEEQMSKFGELVGYAVRFDDSTSEQTKVKYLTDGLLLREMMYDPLLTQYSILMIDEAHERSVTTDLILGLLRKIIVARNDFRIIISSATVDAVLFRDFFELNETNDKHKDTAVILSVEGRVHPVTVYYTSSSVPDYIKKTMQTVLYIHKNEGAGDILAFLTGQDEVESLCNMLSEEIRSLKQVDKLWIVPLYGALPIKQQLKAFDSTPSNTRKVVVATNIAETSLTIPGVVYVIDCGFVRLRVINYTNGLETLMTIPISQASAEQRAGRAGRIRPGKYFILRPSSYAMAEGLQLLYALGALSKDGILTNPLGIQMAEFPLSPMHSKALLSSVEFGCSEEMATIIAMLQIQDVFAFPFRAKHKAEISRRKFSVEEGDHLTLLNVFASFISNGRSKRWCAEHYVNYRGLCRAESIRDQLVGLLKHYKIPMVSVKEKSGSSASIIRCLVKGFFSQAARYDSSGDYVTIRGEHHFKVYRGSAILYRREFPNWVIFSEVLQNSIRDISVIDPEWLYELAPEYYEFGTDNEVARKSFLMIEMAYSRLVSLRSFIIFRLSAPVCLLHGTGKTALHQDDHMEKRELKKPTLIPDGPDLRSFIKAINKRNQKIFPLKPTTEQYLCANDYFGNGLKAKVTQSHYGCQMNANDVEIVRALMFSNGYAETDALSEADVVMLMTCSIRESAERKVWQRLKNIRGINKHAIICLLGCMAERLKDTAFSQDRDVQVIAGPDSYRDLPRLLAVVKRGGKAMNVQLSLEETYADIAPIRTDVASKNAFVSIMRGCDNMCTYCVVPFTRGRERSRPMKSILEEIRRLVGEGFKQITLLGQNVNSYRDYSELAFPSLSVTEDGLASGFRTVYKPKTGGRTFLTLLDEASKINPELRIRFTSPHPKDFPLQLIHLIAERDNVCKQLHLPAQSGSTTVLERMGRGYTVEAYLRLVEEIRGIIKDVSLTSDFIAGFCEESEEDHQRSLELIKKIGYSFCYVYPYSMREKTQASKRLLDNVPPEVKRRRHLELAATFRDVAMEVNRKLIGSIQLVLLEKRSKRSPENMAGLTDGGTVAIVDGIDSLGTNKPGALEPGDYVAVEVHSATSQTVKGRYLSKTTLREFFSNSIGERRGKETSNVCT